MAEIVAAKLYELRLLRCTLPPDESYSLPPRPLDHHSAYSHLSTSTDKTIRLIEAGQYVAALSPDFVRVVFNPVSSFVGLENVTVRADQFYSDLLSNAVNFLFDGVENDIDQCLRVIFLVAIAISAFLAFFQSNITGPKVELPLFHMVFIGGSVVADCGGEWEAWASKQIMSAGCDLLGKISNLEYIVFAKMLLLRIKDALFERAHPSIYKIRSISWWSARILLLQQRLLDHKSSSLFDNLQVLFAESFEHFGSSENIINYWGDMSCQEEASNILSMLHVEAGIMEYTYGRFDHCRLHFTSAEMAAGIQLSVSGALGYRTVHQTEPKAQLVLVSKETTPNNRSTCSTILLEQQGTISSNKVDNTYSHRHEDCEGSDALITPRLLENEGDFVNMAKTNPNGNTGLGSLKATQNMVILARCLLIEKSTRSDEMQGWEMAPYIEAIASQQQSYFIIKRLHDILRIRWEASRSRTKNRALLMMEKLVQIVYEPSPSVAHRIYFCFGVQVPTIPALRKEYGELLVGSGLIGEAVKIFEDLELWDNLINCYSLLDKKAAAIEVINKRLSEMPSDPRLWCYLGDFTNDDAHYRKALEVSDNRSARAKRSLARSAYNRGDYAESTILWESAMALNSLYPNGWFALGAAALKARDVRKALDSFTSAVQLDPENAESWNNIACLHKIKGKNEEAFIAYKEALKFKRNSWHLWENYSNVAADIGNFGQAMEAIQIVLDLTGNKQIDAELLEKLMTEIEKRAENMQSASVTSDIHGYANVASVDYSVLPELKTCKHETDYFVQIFGKILQRMVRNGGSAEIWGFYARWHKSQGDLTMCSESLLKQVRSYQGSDLWKDGDRFRNFANASLKLCEVYMEMASSSGGSRELKAAEMHLKNVIRQAACFSDTHEFLMLHTCLDEVTQKLQSKPQALKH